MPWCVYGRKLKKNQWDAGNFAPTLLSISKVFKDFQGLPSNAWELQKTNKRDARVPLPSQNWDLKLGNRLNCVYQLEIGPSSLCLTNGLVKTKRSIAKDVNFMVSQLFVFLLKDTHWLRTIPKRQDIFNIKTSQAELSALDWGAPSGNTKGSSTTSACEKLWNQNRMRHCSLQLPSLGSSETNGNTIKVIT